MEIIRYKASACSARNDVAWFCPTVSPTALLFKRECIFYQKGNPIEYDDWIINRMTRVAEVTRDFPNTKKYTERKTSHLGPLMKNVSVVHQWSEIGNFPPAQQTRKGQLSEGVGQKIFSDTIIGICDANLRRVLKNMRL